LLARRSFILILTSAIPGENVNVKRAARNPGFSHKNCERRSKFLALAQPIKNQDFSSAQSGI
jgi:hypothetical protein